MSRDDLVATYVADLPADRARQAAEAFATGQSIGTWLPVPGITPPMRRRHAAEVVEVSWAEGDTEVAGDPAVGRWVLRVAFPVENFGPQFPMLLTTLVGNDVSTSIPARLVDVELPATYESLFPGPRFGVDGWRRLTCAHDRPLLLNMIKPCTGFPPDVGAGFAEGPARGGVDLIKDDELLADPSFNRVAERARAYRDRLERVASETGHRARYIANVTTRPARLVDTARAARDAGADAVMVNALAAGLDALQDLAESDVRVPILAHTAGADVFTGGERTGIGQAVLFGKLLRLAGADAVLTFTPYGKRPVRRGVFDRTIDWLLHPDRQGVPSMPMIAGGVTADLIGPLIDSAGVDAILGVGGAIQGHPGGAEAGARAMRAAIDEAMARQARPDRENARTKHGAPFGGSSGNGRRRGDHQSASSNERREGEGDA